MGGLIGILALLIILTLSLVITRIATVALSLTGLSDEAARFQARSAFTGTGFTTSEAETVVDHPVRRKIIMGLMLVRSAGIVSILLSLILSFGSSQGPDRLYRLAVLLAGVIILWLLARSKVVYRSMRKVIRRFLTQYSTLDVRDYIGLLNLTGDYVIREMEIKEDSWLADKQLSECRLDREGSLVLGVYRSDGTYLGAPKGTTQVFPGDMMVLYGRHDKLKQLNDRPSGGSGNREHEEAVSEQREQEARQQKKDAHYQRSKEEEKTD